MFAKSLLVLLVLLFAASASAEKILQVYPLSYRSAEQIIPLLEPHLDAEVSLSGRAGQLIVRAQPDRQREIAQLIEQLDVAPRSLRIAVRSDATAHRGRSGAGFEGRIGAGSGSATTRIYRSESARDDNLDQQVRALEGRPAFIAAGISLPITEHTVVIGREETGVQETIRLLELSKGFYAIAHVHGGRVEIEIATEHAQAGDVRRGGFQRHRVITTISGRLGEWLSVGSSGQSAARDERGTVYRSRDAREQRRGVWLKVDLLDQP